MSDMARQRANMVESQLRPNQVEDPRILAAMGELPREIFVPAALRSLAYMDEEIPLGGDSGCAMMAPMPLARLLQLADIRPGDLVLDVGCGLGYSTAVLGRLAESVVGLESDPALVEAASAALTAAGVDNAVVVEGDLGAGYRDEGPYDSILIPGSVAEVPQSLFENLKYGGRLATVVRHGVVGRATLFTRSESGLVARAAFDCAAPVVPGFAPSPAFVF